MYFACLLHSTSFCHSAISWEIIAYRVLLILARSTVCSAVFGYHILIYYMTRNSLDNLMYYLQICSQLHTAVYRNYPPYGGSLKWGHDCEMFSHRSMGTCEWKNCKALRTSIKIQNYVWNWSFLHCVLTRQILGKVTVKALCI